MFRTVDGFRNIMEIDNVTKAATFKSFLHQSYKNTQLLFFVTVLFNYFHETNINRWFLGVTQKYELRVSFKLSRNSYPQCPVKACCFNIVYKANYLFEQTCFSASLYNYKGKLLSFIAKKIFLENEIQNKSGYWKIYFPKTHSFKEHVKIVKIYMMKFDVTIFNGIKIMGFL